MSDTPDMRQRILDASTRLFARHGVGDTALSQIARAVGVRKSSLLYHFSSKGALHDAVIHALVSRWNARLPDLMLAASTGEGRFEAIVWEVVAFFTEDVDRARLLVREMLDRPVEFRALMREHLGAWIPVVTAALRAGQAEGTIREDLDPENAVMQAMYLLVGGIASYDVLGVFSAEASSTETGAAETAAETDAADEAFEAYLSQLVRFTHAGIFRDPSLVLG